MGSEMCIRDSSMEAEPNCVHRSKANHLRISSNTSVQWSNRTLSINMALTTFKTIPTMCTYLTIISQTANSARAWMFQCCTEYGWWQTVSDIHPLRSNKLDINFYRKFCGDSFGVDLWPDT